MQRFLLVCPARSSLLKGASTPISLPKLQSSIFFRRNFGTEQTANVDPSARALTTWYRLQKVDWPQLIHYLARAPFCSLLAITLV